MSESQYLHGQRRDTGNTTFEANELKPQVGVRFLLEHPLSDQLKVGNQIVRKRVSWL